MGKKIKHDEMNVLLCPECDGENLHHYRVEVADRSEDAENVWLVQTITGEVPRNEGPSGFSSTISQAKNTEARNPSVRRHGMRVVFWCEYCDARPELRIAQHKGLTTIDWE